MFKNIIQNPVAVAINNHTYLETIADFVEKEEALALAFISIFRKGTKSQHVLINNKKYKVSDIWTKLVNSKSGVKDTDFKFFFKKISGGAARIFVEDMGANQNDVTNACKIIKALTPFNVMYVDKFPLAYLTPLVKFEKLTVSADIISVRIVLLDEWIKSKDLKNVKLGKFMAGNIVLSYLLFCESCEQKDIDDLKSKVKNIGKPSQATVDELKDQIDSKNTYHLDTTKFKGKLTANQDVWFTKPNGNLLLTLHTI